jgi:SH3 domain
LDYFSSRVSSQPPDYDSLFSPQTFDNRARRFDCTFTFNFFNVIKKINLVCAHFRESAEAAAVKPYGISLYAFEGQFANELSFAEGEVVFLVEHVDSDWIKGEVNGRRGIFPSNFINIVVDCAAAAPQLPVQQQKQNSFLKASSFARVAFDFEAQMAGDISIRLGETIFMISLSDDQQWATIKKQDGTQGTFQSDLKMSLKL